MLGVSGARPLDFLLRPGRAAVMRAARGTAAALLALAIAIAAGLESPFWAAMTVWLVAQPTRGQLVGKCLGRLAGSIIGAAAAVGFIHLHAISPELFVLVLAVWVGGAALLSNLMTGFRAYAALLSGYTAPLVALSGLHHPDAALVLAASRVGCIAVGILASALLTWFATPGDDLGVLRDRALRLTGEMRTWMRALLAGSESREALARREALLVTEMAILDSQCDTGSSGAPAVLKERRQVRALLNATLTAMAALKALESGRRRPGDGAAAAAELDGLRAALTGAGDARDHADRIEAWGNRATDHPVLPRHHVRHLAEAMRTAASGLEHLSTDDPLGSEAVARPLRHHEWPDALRTGVRTFVTIIVLGTGWVLSGLDLFAMAMMGAAIMCALFATMETPKTSILRAVKGVAAGTVGAAVFVLGVLPFVHSEITLLVALAPFVFVGALALADRRMAPLGMDYSMILMLLSAPAFPVTMERTHFLHIMPGPVLGALAAAAALHLILPTDPARRLADMQGAIRQAVLRLGETEVPVRDSLWRARALHRALRLVVRTSSAGQETAPATRLAILSLALGEDLLALRAIAETMPPGERDALTMALARVPAGDADAAEVFRTLAADPVLARTDRALPGILAEVAVGLELLTPRPA